MVQPLSPANASALLVAGQTHGQGGIRRAEIQAAANALGMQASDLLHSLKAGKSMADLAQQHGVSLDAVAHAMLQPAQTALDSEVKSGKVDQATRDQMLQRLATRVSNFTQLGLSPPIASLGTQATVAASTPWWSTSQASQETQLPGSGNTLGWA